MHTIDPQVAFDHAIKVGALHVAPHNDSADLITGPSLFMGLEPLAKVIADRNVNDYMYMYSDNGADYFKHIDTRKYVTVSHS